MGKRLTVSVLGFGLVILTSACAKPVEEIKVSATPVDKPRLILPEADKLNLRKVNWIVVTPDNIDEVFESLNNERKALSLFALTEDGYESISLNVNDLRVLIQQLNSIIIAYENYYEDSNRAIDLANEKIITIND